MITNELTSTASKLIDVLDRDIVHLNSTLGHLDKLRTFVIKHDDRSLDDLLVTIRKESDVYKGVEKQRHILAERLSKLLNIGQSEFKLATLAEHLPFDTSQQLETRINSLRLLMARLHREHVITVALVADCARLNGMLLSSIFGPSRTTVGYGRSGNAKRLDQTTFMNLKF